MAKCFGCIPLRRGVAVICILSLVMSVIGAMGFCSNGTFLRSFMGGYDAISRQYVGVLGMIGIVASIVGYNGNAHLHAGAVQIFMYYILFRQLSLIGVAAIDFDVLRRCESWSSKTQMRLQPNEAMADIAKAGGCENARVSFMLLFTASWIVWLAFLKPLRDLSLAVDQQNERKALISGDAFGGPVPAPMDPAMYTGQYDSEAPPYSGTFEPQPPLGPIYNQSNGAQFEENGMRRSVY